MVNIHQQPDEGVAEYLKSYKANKDVATTQAGEAMFAHFVMMQRKDELAKVTASNKSDAEKKREKEAILKAGIDEIHGILFLMGADMTKYGSLLKRMRSDYGRQQEKVYPEDLEGAVRALNTHSWDQAYYDNKNKKRQQAKEQKEKEKEQESSRETQTGFAQKGNEEKICFKCGIPGHIVPNCNKDIPKNEWWINKQQQHAQHCGSNGDDNSSDEGSNTQQSSSGGWAQQNQEQQGQQQGQQQQQSQNMQRSSYRPRRNVTSFMGFQHPSEEQQCQACYMTCPEEDKVELKDLLLLDSGSTIKATITNKEMVHNIRPNPEPIAMSTNSGEALLDTLATVPGLADDVHFHEQGMANILGLYHMTLKCRVTMDTAVENCFLVHHPNGIIKFKCTEEGLHAHHPVKGFFEEVAALKAKEPIGNFQALETVKENMEGYSKQQIAGAKAARDLYRHFQCPGYEAFKALLKMNVIQDCPVTIQDADNAQKIFGPDVGLLKGESRRPKQAAHKNEWIETPKEIYDRNGDLDLHIDIMYVNSIPPSYQH